MYSQLSLPICRLSAYNIHCEDWHSKNVNSEFHCICSIFTVLDHCSDSDEKVKLKPHTSMFVFQKSSSQGNSPVWFVFAGMGTQWQGMGRQMMEIDIFKKSILQSDTILKPYSVHLYDLIMEGDASAFENIVHSFVGIAAIQVC